jgi:hypothetical protein
MIKFIRSLFPPVVYNLGRAARPKELPRYCNWDTQKINELISQKTKNGKILAADLKIIFTSK